MSACLNISHSNGEGFTKESEVVLGRSYEVTRRVNGWGQGSMWRRFEPVTHGPEVVERVKPGGQEGPSAILHCSMTVQQLARHSSALHTCTCSKSQFCSMPHLEYVMPNNHSINQMPNSHSIDPVF